MRSRDKETRWTLSFSLSASRWQINDEQIQFNWMDRRAWQMSFPSISCGHISPPATTSTLPPFKLKLSVTSLFSFISCILCTNESFWPLVPDKQMVKVREKERKSKRSEGQNKGPKGQLPVGNKDPSVLDYYDPFYSCPSFLATLKTYTGNILPFPLFFFLSLSLYLSLSFSF